MFNDLKPHHSSNKSLLIVSLVFLLMVIFPVVCIGDEPPLIVEQLGFDIGEEPEPEVELPDISAEESFTETISVINDVRFQGGTVFELESLAELVLPLIGQAASRESLISVLDSITQKYVEAGYPLSYAMIPPGQQLASGRVVIVLVEGYLAASEIDVEETHIEKRLQRYLDRMMQEKPLTTATFERYSALIEATPGYQFRIRVPRPQSASGATTIRVEQASKQGLQSSLAFDKSKNEPRRLFGSLTSQSLTSYGDKLTVSALLPNSTIDRFYSINYEQNLSVSGWQLDVSANHFKSVNDDRFFVTDIPVDFEENKERERLQVGLSYPLTLGRQSSWWLGGRLHYLNERARFELSTNGANTEITKKLRYSALEAYSRWQFRSSQSFTSLQISAKQAMDLGNNKNQLDQAGVSRRGSESTHFTYLNTDFQWRYRLSQHWQLQTRGNAFWSDDILPSAEQARYGGMRFARGYPEGQAQGDRGYAAELEFRYLWPVNGTLIRRVEPYIVLDSARTELRSGGPRASLSSASLGIQLTDNQHYAVNFEYAKPTGDKPIDSDRRNSVYNIRIRWQF